jgi:hypothetical protein
MGAAAQGALLVLERELRREVDAAARAAQEELRAVAALKDQLEAVTAQADQVAARLPELQTAAATWAVRARKWPARAGARARWCAAPR